MNQQPFNTRARKQLTKIVNQRYRLIKSGKSQRTSAGHSADKINTWLATWTKVNDKQMARFILNNLADILNIIPRGKNPAFDGMRLKVEELKREAILINSEQLIMNYE